MGMLHPMRHTLSRICQLMLVAAILVAQVVDMDGTVGKINCFIVEPFGERPLWCWYARSEAVRAVGSTLFP
jgi:hypothetical protein